MRRECDDCGTQYNDEFRSTICPHVGIGFCEICDCVVCVCDPFEKAATRRKRSEWSKHELEK